MAKKPIGCLIDVKVIVNPNGTAVIKSNGERIKYTVQTTPEFNEMVGLSTIAYFRAEIIGENKVMLKHKITNKRW